ncbi:hypothetical protein [Parasphingorhabdus sp.]|uniref:hypothetical protein n=1 Tax=Parasphingorhabdus sp. TaxID=2709688 RepID=UPI0032ED9100
MASIRQQCHRSGQQAVYDFDNDICDIERDSEREGSAEVRRHMAVRAMAIVMAVGGMPVVMMMTCGHLRSDNCNANVLIFDYTD